MGIDVAVEVVKPRKLAAIRRQVPVGAVGSAWRPALDQVWAFLRSQPGLRTDGHNIFLYHHPARRNDPMDVDFGVEVARSFIPSGEIPRDEYSGRRGRDSRSPGWLRSDSYGSRCDPSMGKSHDRTFAGRSWEIYGDPSHDPSKIETTVVYLLA